VDTEAHNTMARSRPLCDCLYRRPPPWRSATAWPGHDLRLPLKTTSAVEGVILGFTPQLPLLIYEADVLLMDRENLGV